VLGTVDSEREIVVDLTSNLHSFDEHQELGSTCIGYVLSQNRHSPLDGYYLAPWKKLVFFTVVIRFMRTCISRQK